MKKIIIPTLLAFVLINHLAVERVSAQANYDRATSAPSTIQPVAPAIGNYQYAVDLPLTTDISPVPEVSQQVLKRRAELQAERVAKRTARENELASLSRLARASERMSEVAQFVQGLLATQSAQGGIGELVRVVAQDQVVAQASLSTKLDVVSERQGLAKWLFGHDQGTLEEIRLAAIDIDGRIVNLETNLDTFSEPEREVALDLIDALKYQRLELLALVEEKSSEFSFINWLKGLFAQTG